MAKFIRGAKTEGKPANGERRSERGTILKKEEIKEGPVTERKTIERKKLSRMAGGDLLLRVQKGNFVGKGRYSGGGQGISRKASIENILHFRCEQHQ